MDQKSTVKKISKFVKNKTSPVLNSFQVCNTGMLTRDIEVNGIILSKFEFLIW